MTIDGTSFAPLRGPTCWEILGFSGPTSRDNLAKAYSDARARRSSISPVSYGFFENAYLDCLAELEEEQSQC